jgi:hypothetical protein
MRIKSLVIDPPGSTDDPKMPFLAGALNPVEAQRRLGGLPSLTGQVHLRAIRMVRHKPGRRCLIEYDVERRGAPFETIVLVGKARARGPDLPGYRLQESLWNAGFGHDSPDGVCVPEPVGLIPEFHMWLQRKVPGTAATRLLPEPGGAALARRIAEAAHKLHRAGIPPSRRPHTMADELRILHERLPLVARMEPRWAKRLGRILDACDRLGGTVPEPEPRGIHRDFYQDQVLVDGPRLYLLDLDLYCEGDPGLDIGNFIGHLTEWSLRATGTPDAFAEQEEALEERFVELSGEESRAAVQAYATLTLARHIHLSTLFPERRPFTESLLELCEERLGTHVRGKGP